MKTNTWLIVLAVAATGWLLLDSGKDAAVGRIAWRRIHRIFFESREVHFRSPPVAASEAPPDGALHHSEGW